MEEKHKTNTKGNKVSAMSHKTSGLNNFKGTEVTGDTKQEIDDMKPQKRDLK